MAAVESGEAEEIEIARAGQVVARIVPARLRTPRRPGSWAGRVRIGPDFDDFPPDVAAALPSAKEFGTLAVTAGHAVPAGSLTPHHTDPIEC